jgi:hypothetical protein
MEMLNSLGFQAFPFLAAIVEVVGSTFSSHTLKPRRRYGPP